MAAGVRNAAAPPTTSRNRAARIRRRCCCCRRIGGPLRLLVCVVCGLMGKGMGDAMQKGLAAPNNIIGWGPKGSNRSIEGKEDTSFKGLFHHKHCSIKTRAVAGSVSRSACVKAPRLKWGTGK